MDRKHLLYDRHLVHNCENTNRGTLRRIRPFVPTELELLKDLDKSNTTAALWVDHKWNTKWQKKYLSSLHIYSFCWPLFIGNDLTFTFLGQTKPSTLTVPFNNAQMGLGVLGELQFRSRGVINRSHTTVSCSPCHTTLRKGHLVWRLSTMTLQTGFKELHLVSDDTKPAQTKEAFLTRLLVSLFYIKNWP